LVQSPTGSPRLSAARVSFDCRVASESRVGTHHLFIGAVDAVHIGDDTGAALVYSERAYCRPEPLAVTARQTPPTKDTA
jgi:flavin reductase